MEKSKVYFTDMRALPGTSLLTKLQRLIRKAGIGDIDMKERFVAIKIHFGEPGNLSYLRPNFAKAVVDVVKEQGGKPFLTDCNTLYVGRRKNALDHLEAAWENGFTPYSCGCPVIIADGLKGTDEILVPVEGGEYVTAAKIGRAVCLSGMPGLRQELRPRSHFLRGRPEGLHRPQQVRGLRALSGGVQLRRHLQRILQRQRRAEL